jgi:hypothetical protein
MKNSILFAIILIATCLVSRSEPIQENINSNFIVNQGQYPKDIILFAKLDGYTSYLTSKGLYYHLSEKIGKEIEGQVVQMDFENANFSDIEYSHPTNANYNFMKGKNASSWIIGAKEYKTATVRNIWQGINLRLYFVEGNIRYDFEVEPNANISNISIKFNGVNSTEIRSIDGQDVLCLKTNLGEIQHSDLNSYLYNSSSHKSSIKSEFKLENGRLSFNVANYDKTKKLLIDPVIGTRILNGATEQEITGLLNIGDTSLVIAGWTSSSDFSMVTGYYKAEFSAGKDIFVQKYRIFNGFYELQEATFIGSEGDEEPIDIQRDFAGDYFLAGYTTSADFPKVNTFGQPYKGGREVFVLKMKSDFKSLEYSGMITGTDEDRALCMHIRDNFCFVGGLTRSSDFYYKNGLPISNKYKGNGDGFFARINTTGSSIDICGFIGGTDEDQVNGIYAEPGREIMITGQTKSIEFPVHPNTGGMTPDLSYDVSHNGGWDAFMCKIAEAGTTFIFSSYFGGSNDDYGIAIGNTETNEPYLVGYTMKENQTNGSFPTSENSYQKAHKGGTDIFIAEFTNLRRIQLGGFGNPSAFRQNLYIATFYGGSGNEIPSKVTFNPKTSGYSIVGRTNSTNLPLAGFETRKLAGIADGFIAEISPTLSSLIGATYFGGNNDDGINAVAVDDQGNYYVGGYTTSRNIWGSGDNSTGISTRNAFFSKFVDGLLVLENPAPASKVCYNSSLNVTWNANNLTGGIDVYLGSRLQDGSTSYSLLRGKVNSSPLLYEFPKNMTPGIYTVRLSNRSGISSNSGTFIVQGAPQITDITLKNSQIDKTQICEGDTVTLTSEDGNNGYLYTWRRNGVNVEGTTSTLKLNAITSAMSGTYTATAKGDCTPDATRSIVVNVEPKVTITQNLENLTVVKGKDLNLSVNHTGTAKSYTWYKNAAKILGQTTKDLSVKAVTVADEGKYKCEIEGLCNSVVSAEADVKIDISSVAKDLPEYISVSENESEFTFTNNSQNLNYTLKLVDLSGNEIERREISNQVASISKTNKSNGVYLVYLQFDNQSFVHKLIVSK